MNSIDEALFFVKEQAEYQFERSVHYEQQGDLTRSDAYRNRYRQFLALSQFLKDNLKPDTVTRTNSVHLTPEDLADLPPELLEQLNISESDRQEFLIMEVLDELGGFASIDKIMIHMYKKSGEILDRQKLNARLYRMSTKNLIHSFPNRKGVYSLKPITEEEGQNMEA